MNYLLPRVLESSLKLESWNSFPLTEYRSNSSLNVGSPSRRVLWTTINVLIATCINKFRDIYNIIRAIMIYDLWMMRKVQSSCASWTIFATAHECNRQRRLVGGLQILQPVSLDSKQMHYWNQIQTALMKWMNALTSDVSFLGRAFHMVGGLHNCNIQFLAKKKKWR